jgi:ribose-phosphate pyrophosphokinase
MNIIGDMAGKDCMLIDDIVDSGGTLCNAAEALLAKGAKRDRLHHPWRALRRRGGPCRFSKLKELVITDSIQPTQEVLGAPNIRVISTDTLIGEAINRTAAEQSVSSLFD